MAWKAGNAGTIATVKSVMGKNNILVTRRSYQGKGGLFDQQPLRKGKGQVPLKGNDERLRNVNRYGGYGQAARTYFMLVESDEKKGTKKRSVESVPLYLCGYFEEDKGLLQEYLERDCRLKNPKVLISKIKVGTLFKVDGFLMWLATKNGNQLTAKGANQLILEEQSAKVLKKVLKYINYRRVNKDAVVTVHDQLKEMELIELYDVFLDKIRNSVYHTRLKAPEKVLSNKRDVFCTLSSEDKCLVISEILHMFQCQSKLSNLKLIGGSENTGKIQINSNITQYKNISIIHQSPAGIYEQEIDLKKV